MIKIQNLNHTYENRKECALKNINLNIEKGENIILLGPSGSGKSTLIKCINRLIEPTSGDIFIEEENILTLKEKEVIRIRKKIGTIFQEFNLIESDTVLKNVLNGRLGFLSTIDTFFNKFKKEDYEIVEQNLKDVGLFDLKKERVCNLSGGQKQRVAIARALSQEPKIMLADEPVSNLDPKLMTEILDLLLGICKERQITLITSLHFVELVKKYASRVIGISEGSIIFDNTLEEWEDEENLKENLKKLGYLD